MAEKLLGVTMRSNEVRVEDGDLLCPNCNEVYLHSDTVYVYNREEDADKVSVTTVHTNDEVVRSMPPHDLSGNPSGRRHGIKIAFYCEGCHDWGRNSDRYYLNIAQHKGVTFMYWDDQYGRDA